MVVWQVTERKKLVKAKLLIWYSKFVKVYYTCIEKTLFIGILNLKIYCSITYI